jgi:hypothetical protein
MTLKEKFYKEFISKPDLYPLDECEQIADEFAIGFADYCLSIFGRLRDREITIDEALEIYKKEKGL